MAAFLRYNRDTVAVALNYFDRYTCEKRCSPTLAQAVAATALHIAAKFEETNPASLVRGLAPPLAFSDPNRNLNARVTIAVSYTNMCMNEYVGEIETEVMGRKMMS